MTTFPSHSKDHIEHGLGGSDTDAHKTHAEGAPREDLCYALGI